MGATDFSIYSKGKNAEEAFNNAREQAFYNHGHEGYTGTIAEKDSFELLEIPSNKSQREFVDSTIEDNDKWGPAYCIEISKGEYYFYGIASF